MSHVTVRIPIDEVTRIVRGRRVGVLTNATCWLEQAGDDLVGVVRAAASQTVLIYGEHGVRGDEGASEPRDSTRDAYTGCETRCLYEWRSAAPSSHVLNDLDVVVVGMPEAGVRHYSYRRTLCHIMVGAAVVGKPVVVIDMPNPVRGDIVEGNYPDPAYYDTFPADTKYCWFAAPIALRHGMTIGEMALMAKDHLHLDLDLQVVKMVGWRRDMWWDQTGWPYVPFDPSMYNPETLHAFLCTGLLQGTSVSWGIGTADPFRVIGAPWVEDDRLLDALRRHDLPGVTWTRAHFVPRWHEGELWGRFADQPCNGVRLHFTDRDAVSTAAVQVTVIAELCRLYPDRFTFDMQRERFECRLEDRQWVPRFKSGEPVAGILAEWRRAAEQFDERRRPYLLY